MSSMNKTTGIQNPQHADPKRAPVLPEKNNNDRKDAESKEGKPQEAGKSQQK